MARGRRRKPSPHIPSHIDQSRLPTGIYFDHRGSGCWYTLFTDEGGRQRRTNLADRKALLSDLHRIMEERKGIDRTSLTWLCEEFSKSDQYRQLAISTRRGYDIHSQALINFDTRVGKLGDLAVNRFSPPLVQRIIDKIAAAGTPAKAVHCLQYLRRLCRWGMNRGYCTSNPARGIEAPTQRRRRRLPDPAVWTGLVQLAARQGALGRGKKGSLPPYLWYVMDIACLCRLRGIEVITLTDAHETAEGVQTNRRKGSRDNIVRWTPRLRAAWEAAKTYRADVWKSKRTAIPMDPAQRSIIVAAHGGHLQKTSLDTAWQRLIKLAIEEGVITEELRFGLHDLKRRGITDTSGNRHQKQEASGHRSGQMLDVYDFSLPIVDPSAL